MLGVDARWLMLDGFARGLMLGGLYSVVDARWLVVLLGG